MKVKVGIEMITEYNAMFFPKAETTEKDGGPGSGNWGHEGRPGEVGGSAEGGGIHNRMTVVSGGYTSFSKEKKKFAAPHKVTDSELDKCPEGSKVAFEHGGKKVMYQKQADGTFISSDGKTASTSEISQTLADTQSDAAIYVPDSASPNYSVHKGTQSDEPKAEAHTETPKAKVHTEEPKAEAYSEERKSAAPRKEKPKAVDAILRGNTEKVWNEADDATKDALVEYTVGEYHAINDALRDEKAKPDKEVKAEIDAITEAISKSKLESDIWLARGVNASGSAAYLNISEEEILGNVDFDPQSLVGKKVTDDAFMSCGSTKSTGFDWAAVQYSIYCPEGTEALYAEPFSAFGGSKQGRDWNGTDRQKKFSNEFETILQRGTECRITKAYRGKDGKLYVEMEVVSQNYKK